MTNQPTEQRNRTWWTGAQRTASLWTQERPRSSSSTLGDPRLMIYSHWQKSCRTACGEDKPWKSGRSLIFLVNLHPNHCKYCRRPVGTRMDPTFTQKTVKFGGGKIITWGYIQFWVVRGKCSVWPSHSGVCSHCYVFAVPGMSVQYSTLKHDMFPLFDLILKYSDFTTAKVVLFLAACFRFISEIADPNSAVCKQHNMCPFMIFSACRICLSAMHVSLTIKLDSTFSTTG